MLWASVCLDPSQLLDGVPCFPTERGHTSRTHLDVCEAALDELVRGGQRAALAAPLAGTCQGEGACVGLAAFQGAAMVQTQLACEQRRSADRGLRPGCAE